MIGKNNTFYVTSEVVFCSVKFIYAMVNWADVKNKVNRGKVLSKKKKGYKNREVKEAFH